MSLKSLKTHHGKEDVSAKFLKKFHDISFSLFSASDKNQPNAISQLRSHPLQHQCDFVNNL